MTTVRPTAINTFADLADSIAGEVILPDHPDYQEARRLPHLSHNHFPSAVVRVASPEDVALVVKFARRRGIPFSVRGGGHSLAGFGAANGAIVIDMREMREVTIDPERQTARAQGGARSYDLVIPAHEHGLSLSTGDTGSVGLGGLVTGGGIGFFVRKYGLAADRLISAKVVTADGDLITASATENPDLLWAIKGGGGNFGIVVEFEFAMVPVKYVVGGALLLPATKEVVRGYLDYSVAAPDGLSTTATILHAPPAPFVPEDRVGERVLLILCAFAGGPAEAEKALAPLRALAEPVADTVALIPYPEIYQYMQWAEAPHGGTIRMMFTDEVPDSTIDDFIDAIDNAAGPMCGVHLRGLGGELARIPEESTAFAHRQRRYFVALLGVWMDPADDPDAHRAWTEGLWERISHLRDGVYVNFLEDEGQARVREAYPDEVYRRLAEVKAKYDPENVFQFNQNVRPAAGRSERAAA